ncbi:acyl-CoA dehydrogenase family protein [Streptomyces sp. NPDC058464]|uniref:acyl-CoA dehydrogenase family protein n=1 Tax=Streptomyces sp. NPDC058464 TaxID=3346511 RepID=UPI0036664637
MTTTPDTFIKPPETDVTVEDLIARAIELRPRLREEQAAVEERGTYSPEMHELFKQAGFYRIMQPKRWGGFELGVKDFLRVMIEIARGCPGTGWCLTLAAGHQMHISGFFGEEAQIAAFGEDGHFAAPYRPMPEGTAERVPGGWKVNGKWNYCSGAPYSTHAILGARLLADDAPHPVGQFVIARDQWELLPGWADSVLGMRGSGSNSIRIVDGFVPDHSMIFGAGMNELPKGATSPGYVLHGNPTLACIPRGYGGMELAAVLTGAALAAQDEYEDLLINKKTFGPKPQPRVMAPEYQKAYCKAIAKIEAAHATLLSGAERYQSACQDAIAEGESGAWSTEIAKLDLITHEVTFDLLWEAVELLFSTSGSSEGARNGSRIQRYYRDMSMARTNVYTKTPLSEGAYLAARFNIPELAAI